MIQRFIPLLIAICAIAGFTSSCATSRAQKELQLRTQAENKRPTWAKQTPINNDGFYWGVGEVILPKGTPLGSNQRERVKQDALNDIANAISVHVNTQSILTTSKVSDQLKQTFQKSIKLSSKLKLDGIEMVDSYRDEYGYFELYRLNQASYLQQHQRTRQAALDQSTQWLDAVATARQKGDYRSALLFALKTLHGLSDYWDEEILIVRSGKQVNPLAEADREIHEVLRSLTIRPIVSPLELTPGIEINNKNCGFRVTGNESKRIQDLPFKLQSEGVTLSQTTSVTDSQGEFTLTLRSAHNAPQLSFVKASVDIRPIIIASAVSESIGQYATRLQMPEAKIEIRRLSPLIHIINASKGDVAKQLNETLSKEMEQKGVVISTSPNALTIETTLHTKTTSSNNYVTVQLNLSIRYNGKIQSELIATHSALTESEATQLCMKTLTTDIRAKAATKIYYTLFEE